MRRVSGTNIPAHYQFLLSVQQRSTDIRFRRFTGPFINQVRDVDPRPPFTSQKHLTLLR
jgi:hypothetical protein